MSEKTTCPSKCHWSRLFTGVFASVLLAAVPVLALLVLGADVYSLVPADGDLVQSPLTFDAPTTKLLKVKPAQTASGEGLAKANVEAVLLSKWKYSSDLFTMLDGGAGNNGNKVDPNLLLLTALFALQDNLLASASPTLAPMLLTLFTQQNTILAELLGLPTTGF
jgi:hypothetical protein